MRLVFVTGNAGKFKEASHELQGLAELEQDNGGYVEIQADTLEAVAQHGLDEVAKRRDPPFFLEDAGLFVDALDGFPGVYSAYALKTLGCQGLLRLLFDHRGPEARRAAFAAVVAYRDAEGRDHLFRGEVKGHIHDDEVGEHGFGFDPVFVPLGHQETFAQMGLDAKMRISHRGKAMQAFRAHLEKHPLPDDPAPDPSAADPSDISPIAAPAPAPSAAAPASDKTTKTKAKTKGHTKKRPRNTAKPVKKDPAAPPRKGSKEQNGDPDEDIDTPPGGKVTITDADGI